MKLLIQTDGASRGNPGAAAYGFIIYKDGEVLKKEGKTLGITTNNIAEYTGLVRALEYLANEVKPEEVGELAIEADSQLMIRQLTGMYKVKNEGIKPLFNQIKAMLTEYENVEYKHIFREFNTEADLLGNLALDGKI
jgi:ribonuclease HI